MPEIYIPTCDEIEALKVGNPQEIIFMPFALLPLHRRGFGISRLLNS
jgi:hypothetical protein